MRMLAVVWVLSSGCEIVNAPDRVHALETRIDELSAEIHARDSKPAGAGESSHGQGEHAARASSHAHGDEHAPRTQSVASHGEVHRGPATHAASVAGGVHAGAAPHWAYEGPEGADRWGDLDPSWSTCSAGKEQSPIDILPHATTATPIEFNYHPVSASVVDNGHTGQVNLAVGSSIAIDGHTYELVQFHTHTPSEHTIAGERFPLEVHLVHKDVEGKLAVIGVLYDEGANSRALEPLWSKWPREEQSERVLTRAFDPTTLLPTTRTVYRYAGSLTTPPCTEGVVWNVMRRTMSESKSHIGAIASHYTNARAVQDLGGRPVD